MPCTHLLRARNDFKPLGVRWYTQFLNRHPEFKLKYSRSLNQDRIDITDYGVIERWFNLFNEMRQKYGVVNNDIYNMDEKAIAQGLIENAKIIVRRHDLKRFMIQPGNRDWVSLIECISIEGYTL